MDYLITAIVTFLGVGLGAYFGYRGERKIAHEERERREAKQKRQDQENLLAHLDRVSREIRDNEQYVSKMIYRFDVWDESDGSKVSVILDWAGKWADGLSVAAYDSLAVSGLQRLLPDDLQDDLFDARQRTVDLKTVIKASPKDTNLLAYISQKDFSIQTIFNNVKTSLHTTQETLDRVKKAVFEHTKRFSVEVRSGRS